MKSQNIIVDSDVMKVVFNATSEAKLIHMCRTYNDAMACLREKTSTCSDDYLLARLAEIGRLLSFLCSPFSLSNQRTLLKISPCMREALQTPIRVEKCANRSFTSKLDLCREKCERDNAGCHSKVQMSELAVCSVVSIEKKCGSEAANFYTQLHSTMINGEYPIQCDYGKNEAQSASSKTGPTPTEKVIVKVRPRMETRIFRSSRVTPDFNAYGVSSLEEPSKNQFAKFPSLESLNKTPEAQATTVESPKYVPWYFNNSSNQDVSHASNDEPLDIKISFATTTTSQPEKDTEITLDLPSSTEAAMSAPALNSIEPTLNSLAQNGRQVVQVLVENLDRLMEKGSENNISSSQMTIKSENNVVPKQALNQLFSAIYSLSQSVMHNLGTNSSSPL
uniref:CPG4 domain-containing protein n=1 Tax=Steinernema glaseri TaxID=37863 RepID=A0A1I7Z3Y4_9BILA